MRRTPSRDEAAITSVQRDANGVPEYNDTLYDVGSSRFVMRYPRWICRGRPAHREPALVR